jgi:hypothetical protein
MVYFAPTSPNDANLNKPGTEEWHRANAAQQHMRIIEMQNAYGPGPPLETAPAPEKKPFDLRGNLLALAFGIVWLGLPVLLFRSGMHDLETLLDVTLVWALILFAAVMVVSWTLWWKKPPWWRKQTQRVDHRRR